MSDHTISRRNLIISAAIIPVSAIRSAAATTPATALTEGQLKILDAFTDRLIPRDENGPGARDCGASNYINRVLSDTIAGEKPTVVDGLTALDAFAVSSQGKPFAELATETQDTVLMVLEAGQVPGFTPNSRAFFNRIRRLTLEGTFSDPFYGGNKGFAGWDLIGYPGPRQAVSAEEQKMHVDIKPMHISAWGGVNNGH
jgi:gluconate 2-dehydrogenase gamma chain